ncbi:multidrug effflux MFS transporter [Sphingomonas sp. BT-65]|uniref:multidrug effflux MFS transporter n=1 Tax=Sphingomonas sp. BT-65 TaxID=2989821 RepID=UPI002235CE2C|nr:multidrug effflux MFS transporter [Sphingomonas sp. BT-65]MCW4462834.1 multidrug effflux MFS transporter [Sphingomonas sp. BT-65]
MDAQTSHQPGEAANRSPIPMAEFVALIASIMALTALGIDSMLPALPSISDELGVAQPNHRQYVITAFMLGFGVAQLFHGPLADRYGRKPVIAVALGFYVVTNAVAAFAGSFELLLLARAASGAAVAAGRVVTVALVRDCFQGRAMARVMSLAFMTFMVVPVLAPAWGQLMVLVFGDWRPIFGGIALIAALVLIWFTLRMPETLARDSVHPLDLREIWRGYRTMFRDRWAVGYTFATTAISGCFFSFIGSIQQIVYDVFKRPELLTAVFASVAGLMALGSFMNSRLVMRFGMRFLSHFALVATTVLAVIHLTVILLGGENLWVFIVLQAPMMAAMALANSNFSAMAMENMGEIAGTASSLQGFIATMGAAVMGAVIGQSFDGTTVPLYLGFTALGLTALLIVFITERGKLFRRS